jgi:hypothetical protein
VNKCPKCGHEWPDNKRASGGKARWRGLTKKQRSQAASDAAKARWARTPNYVLTKLWNLRNSTCQMKLTIAPANPGSDRKTQTKICKSQSR